MENTYKIDIPDIIRQTYSLYYLVGTWNKKDGITSWQYCCVIYFVLLVASIFMGAISTENSDEKIYQMVATFIGFVQICRMQCLISKQKEILAFTHDNRTPSTNDHEVFIRSSKKIKNITLLAKLYIYIVFGAVVAVIFFPFGSTERNLIFNIPFPYDYKNSERAFWMAYAFILFGFFFISSLCICGSIYTLAFNGRRDLFQIIFHCVVLFYCFVDIFMLMYLGNEIKLSTDRLSYCLFQSNWIEQTEFCKKYFIIVVERLKQPQQLTVGKLFPLNLQTFTAIVNRAYSMFNILLNFR